MRKVLTNILFFCLPQLLFAQTKTDSLMAIINQNLQDSNHVKTLINLGIEYERKDTDKSLEYFDRAIRFSEKILEEGSWLALAFIRKAGIFSSIGNIDSADYFFSKAKECLEKYPFHPKRMANYHTGLGIYYNTHGKYNEAIQEYKTVIGFGEEVMGKEGLAGNYINLSNVYGRIGENEPRQEYVFKALEIFEKTKNPMGLSFCYNALGNIFYEVKDYSKAKLYFEKSLKIREETGDQRGIATMQNNLANIYMDTGDLESAIAFHQKSMAIRDKMGLKEEFATNHINLGKIYHKKGDPELALSHLETAKKILKEIGSNKYDGFISGEIGKIQSEQFDKENAVQSLLLGIAQARESMDKKSEATAYKFLVDHYQKENDFKNAFEALTRLHQLMDSLEGSDLKLNLSQLESKYQLDLRESELALIKAEQELDKAEIEKSKANQKLYLAILVFIIILAAVLFNRFRVLHQTQRQLEVEKLRNAIARDLDDDLGSALSSIHILSQMALQKEKIQDKGLFSKINAQTAAMMDRLGDIVWSIHPNNDNVEQLLSKMQEFAGEILEPKGITYAFEVAKGAEEIKLDLEKRRNIFLIFKEALNNAAKYAESRHLDIKLDVEDGKLNLMIKDDGKGFDIETIKKGNGLFNMQQRASIMGGNMVIESFPQMGTSILLRAPIT
jgi:signal transduction histidine kinase